MHPDLVGEVLLAEAKGFPPFVAPADLTISNKRTGSGTSYYTATTKNGVAYDCEMEGGSIVTFGLHNPPTCKKKGT